MPADGGRPSPAHVLAEALHGLPGQSVLVVDADLRLLSVFGELSERIGLGPADVGNSAPASTPDATWDLLRPAFESALADVPLALDVCPVDGEPDVWELTATPVREDGLVVGACVTVRDVTTVRAMSDELVRVAREFESFVGTSPEGHYRISPDGIVLWASPSMAVLTGKPMSEILGVRVRGVVHPDDVHKRDAAMAELLRTRAPQTFEVRGEHADGNWRWFEGTMRALFDDDGNVLEFHNTTRDVTQHKALASAEREARAVFSAAVDQAPIGMCLVSPEGQFLRVNAALCKLLGRPPAELLGLTFQEITHPDDLAADLALVHEVLSGARDSYEMQKRFLLPDGNFVAAWLLVTLIRDADGSPAHFISQIVDLTEAQEAESRVRVLEDRHRIAGEFHDHVVQRLFGAGLMLQGVEMALADSPHGERLSAAVNEIDETIREIRSAIYGLRTS